MSTHKHIDIICLIIIILSLFITVLFMNGEDLGIKRIVDGDAENGQFTVNDLNADWDSTDATQITLTGDGGKVTGDGAYILNGDVHILYAGKYVISGELTDGSIIIEAESNDKIWILLNGVSLHCNDNAAILVEQADKVFLTLASGTENSVSSGKEYTEKAVSSGIDAAIYSRDDLTINGSGSLAVNAEYKHGIVGNDDLVIAQATIEITSAQDGIHANDSARFADVNITIHAGDDGITVSNDDETAYVYIESGNFNIPTCYEGIEAINITIAGGVIDIRPTDDGINANGRGSNSVINITGGDITIINENGRDADGLDSNGDIYISGGNIFISVNTSSCALDYGTENGGVGKISGGTVIAAGGSNMAEGFDSSSEQSFIMYNTSTSSAGTTVTLKNAEGNTLVSRAIPCSFSSVVISTPELQLGETCTVFIGDSSQQITVDNSSGSGGFGKGGMFGGRGDKSDRFSDDQANADGERPQRPNDGFANGEMPQRPGGSFDQGNTPPEMPNDDNDRFGGFPMRDDNGQPDGNTDQFPWGNDDSSGFHNFGNDDFAEGNTPPELPSDETAAASDRKNGQSNKGMQRPDNGRFNGHTEQSANNNLSSLILLCISALTLGLGLAFALLFKQRR